MLRISLVVCLLSFVATKSIAQEERKVSVSHHPGLSITNEQVDEILKIATEAIQKDSDGAGKGDVACIMVLKRDGDVIPFTNGSPKVIDSPEDMELLRSEPGIIKLVESIKWCGRELKEGEKPFPECAKKGEKFVVVVDSNPSGYTAMKWVHGWGHATGLVHNESVPLAAMTNGPVHERTTYINAKECKAMAYD